jgi:hypothetical protein
MALRIVACLATFAVEGMRGAVAAASSGSSSVSGVTSADGRFGLGLADGGGDCGLDGAGHVAGAGGGAARDGEADGRDRAFGGDEREAAIRAGRGGGDGPCGNGGGGDAFGPDGRRPDGGDARVDLRGERGAIVDHGFGRGRGQIGRAGQRARIGERGVRRDDHRRFCVAAGSAAVAEAGAMVGAGGLFSGARGGRDRLGPAGRQAGRGACEKQNTLGGGDPFGRGPDKAVLIELIDRAERVGVAAAAAGRRRRGRWAQAGLRHRPGRGACPSRTGRSRPAPRFAGALAGAGSPAMTVAGAGSGVASASGRRWGLRPSSPRHRQAAASEAWHRPAGASGGQIGRVLQIGQHLVFRGGQVGGVGRCRVRGGGGFDGGGFVRS